MAGEFLHVGQTPEGIGGQARLGNRARGYLSQAVIAARASAGATASERIDSVAAAVGA
ncbi:MAG: hypothetical protein IPF60_07040 [Betaproteobacteria bacterium]|nr:hypothetical protein [Betaproteobacteria bacterium]